MKHTKLKYYSTIGALSLLSAVSAFAMSNSDQRIKDAALNSYNYRTVLDQDHIKIKVDNGIVTLTGKVQDTEDRALAEDTVENIPGVLGVNNRINVDQRYQEHSDGWIALKIRSELLMRSNVSAADTKVDVNDGVVTLSGTADNQAQRDLTEEYAKDINGVKTIKNQIVVNDTNGPPVAVRANERVDDASITTQVKFALMDHSSTSAIKTHITTENGIVHITGEAQNDAERSLVTKLATDVHGAESVNNDMTIRDQ